MPTMKLGDELIRDLDEFVDAMEHWVEKIDQELEDGFRVYAERWKGEAQRRVPESPALGKHNKTKAHLHQRILTNVYVVGGEVVMEVGSNLEHAVYVEFGTERIAKGRVKALGYDPHVTDAQAVTSWPAKELDGATRDQMPWLRPAFWAVRDEFVAMLESAVDPPERP